MFSRHPIRHVLSLMLAIAVSITIAFAPDPAQAQSAAFKQAVATSAAKNKTILAFYKSRDYRPIWTGNRDRQRRKVFLDTLSRASDHGLPEPRYSAGKLKKAYTGFKSPQALGELEVATTQAFLLYANDVQSGILEPRRIDRNMTLRAPRRDPLKTLTAFAKSSPAGFLRNLPPQSADYQKLLKEKKRMERIVGNNSWGQTVPASKLKPGDQTKAVSAMRKRLSAMGYGALGASPAYDASVQKALQRFQIDHGLNPDGVAGKQTMAALNTSPGQRLMQVVIGLERLRWLNKPLGKRHIMVNEADFMAFVVDNNKVTFSTRVVVGKPGRWRTPEFEKAMTHLIVNPSWYVPASIAGGEYLPLLKENADSLQRQGIEMTDTDGNRVNPTSVDYSQYSKDNFPFTLRQPPSDGNALGKVKFLFPNRHAIYLHDTPSKSLFGRDIRTFSHGCVRVQQPMELAYALLAKQSGDPQGLFNRALASGREVQIDLVTPVPIYLVYRTAWVDRKGRPNYRADSYKVDSKVFAALKKAGVKLRGVKG